MINTEKTDRLSIQESEYFFPYHFLNLLSNLQDIEYVSYLKIISDIMGSCNGKRILDFGCGDGRFEYEFKKKDCKILGVDLSEKALSFARAFNLENKNAVFKKLDLLKYKSSSKFDYIVSIDTLEHIEPKKLPKIIEKLSRLLKEQGLMILSVPSKNIPLSPKHFQHFDMERIHSYLGRHFVITRVVYQYNLGFKMNIFRIFNALGRVLEIINKESSKRFGELLWRYYHKNLELSDFKNAKRIIVVCKLK